MKKTIASLLALVMLVTCLAACNSNSETGSSSSSSASSSKEEPAEKVVMRVSYTTTNTSARGKAIEWLKSYLEEQTNGNFTMEIYDAGQLYDDSTEIDAITAGNIDMICPIIAKEASVDPDVQSAGLPFLFEDAEDMSAFYASEYASECYKNLEAIGITPLGGWYSGDGYWCSCTDINSLADLNGMKVRDPGGEVNVKMYNALGASIVNVTYAELYTSMQSGMIDMCMNTLDSVTGIALQEVLSNLVFTGHSCMCYLVQVNSDFLSSLSDEYREILIKGVQLAGEKNYEFLQADNESLKATIESAGVKFTTLSDEDMEELKEVWGAIREECISPTWKNAVDAYRASK